MKEEKEEKRREGREALLMSGIWREEKRKKSC